MNNNFDERPYRLNKDLGYEIDNNNTKPAKYRRLPFIVEAVICVAIILTALGIKYLDKDSYSALQQSYIEVMSDELSLFGIDQAVFGEQNDEQLTNTAADNYSQPDNLNPKYDEAVSAQTGSDSNTTDAKYSDKNDDKRYASTAKVLGYEPFSMPVEGATLTDDFGIRLTDESVSFHKGLDLAVPFGTPITPAMNGTVIAVGESESYGNYIKVLHTEDVSTFYAHCSSIQSSEGDAVTTEDVIAFAGSTGDSTGPHVHFEVRFDDYAMDPNGFFTKEVMQTVKNVAESD